MIATDGRRLAFISKDVIDGVEDFTPAIVPPKILSIISKRAASEGPISIAITDKNIFFKFGNYIFSSLLIEGQFPNYKRVIPETQGFSFEIEKSDLTEALKRVSLLVEKKSRRIYLELAPGTLTISSKETEIGTAKEEIPCRYDGEEVSIALNYLYVDEPLKVMESDRLVMEFTDPMKAVTLRSEPQTDYFHILMPMQTK
jgi:DNA polymerase-3 subunit beta